jgi:AcrR family transcriptional regulator
MGKRSESVGAPTPSQNGAAQAPKDASKATRRHIIDCAREVLVTEGYARFTVRAVATAAGISPGNLAYHFPSKRDLLRGVVAQMVADYSSQFEALLGEGGVPQGQDVRSLVRWLLTESVSEETVKIFRELWVIALHDEDTRTAIDDMYDELMAGVVERLRRSYPNAELHKLQEVVQLLACISEGSIVLYGTRSDRAVPNARMIEVVSQLVDLYLPELGRTGGK